MNFDGIFSLADSKNVALALSLVFNFILVWCIRRVYRDKEKSNDRQAEILKLLVPYAMSKSNERN